MDVKSVLNALVSLMNRKPVRSPPLQGHLISLPTSVSLSSPVVEVLSPVFSAEAGIWVCRPPYSNL